MTPINKREKDGVSLVEILIAMTILSIFAATVLSAILLGRRLAEANIYQNTALTVTQGYLEQVKSMEYGICLAAIADNNLPLPTKSISSLIQGTSIEVADPIYLNSQRSHSDNDKAIVIDIRNLGSGNPSAVTMQYKIRPTVIDLDVGAFPIQAMEFTFDYQYLSPEKGTPEWKDGQITVF